VGRLRTFQTNFRRGRIGNAVLGRMDTNAYQSSVKDARNMMVLSDGRCVRRWGSEWKKDLTEEARIESWEYAAGEKSSFILVFTAGAVAIYDSGFNLAGTFSGAECAWTAQTKWFMTMTKPRNQFIICDASFQPVVIEIAQTFTPPDVYATSFEINLFEFEVAPDQTEVYEPYVDFTDEIEVTTTIYTSAGFATGYGVHVAAAAGILVSSFDLAAGTGTLTTDVDFFNADHVGNRLRIEGGEVEVLTYVSATEVTVKVYKNLSYNLDADPFLFQKGSRIVKVFAFSHNLIAGDEIYFTGVSDVDLSGVSYAATNILNEAAGIASSSTGSANVVGTAGAYTVNRVIDEDTFEINAGGTVPTNEEIGGGNSVEMFKLTGMRSGIKEAAMSDVRGWPQACGLWQRRLWLGGTESLPDAMWGSGLFTIENFNMGDGSPTDGVSLLGVGEQARIRHLVAGYDLSIFTDSAEFYIPGSDSVAITQETARAVATTQHGAAYATPRVFDGAAMFVDAYGHHVREFIAENKDANYRAPPLTVATQDWMALPRDTAIYEGGTIETTPYFMLVNSEDGSMLVMHSARGDDSMGFMRWDMVNANFVSVACVFNRAFAVIERDGDYSVVQFDTTGQEIYSDDATKLVGLAGVTEQTDWVSAHHASRNCVLHDGREILPSVTPDISGNFVTSELRLSVVIGDEIPWLIEVLPPVFNMPNGPGAGKMQRIVSIDVYWDNIWDGEVEGKPIPTAIDAPAMEIPSLINEWREYRVTKWGRSPTLVISGSDPARGGIKAMALNMYV